MIAFSWQLWVPKRRPCFSRTRSQRRSLRRWRNGGSCSISSLRGFPPLCGSQASTPATAKSVPILRSPTIANRRQLWATRHTTCNGHLSQMDTPLFRFCRLYLQIAPCPDLKDGGELRTR